LRARPGLGVSCVMALVLDRRRGSVDDAGSREMCFVDVSDAS
jgi:hypothetical protein